MSSAARSRALKCFGEGEARDVPPPQDEHPTDQQRPEHHARCFVQCYRAAEPDRALGSVLLTPQP